MRSIKYYNGKEVKVPEWYMNFPGHDFEDKLTKVFPSLTKFKSKDELKQRLITLYGKCFPFIPLDTAELINEISIR